MIHDGERLYGCDQAWYQSRWRRKSGCGPTTATNLLIYLNKQNGHLGLPYGNVNIRQACRAMDDVFRYVRPSPLGLFSTRLFVKGLEYLADFYGLHYKVNMLTIPALRTVRPNFSDVLRFIEDGICTDAPVAFFNLHAGRVTEVESLHWVTLVKISQPQSTGEVPVTLYDNSKQTGMDIAQWFTTTSMGGGFVYLSDAVRCKPLLNSVPNAGIKVASVTHKCSSEGDSPGRCRSV